MPYCGWGLSGGGGKKTNKKEKNDSFIYLAVVDCVYVQHVGAFRFPVKSKKGHKFHHTVLSLIFVPELSLMMRCQHSQHKSLPSPFFFFGGGGPFFLLSAQIGDKFSEKSAQTTCLITQNHLHQFLDPNSSTSFLFNRFNHAAMASYYFISQKKKCIPVKFESPRVICPNIFMRGGGGSCSASCGNK